MNFKAETKFQVVKKLVNWFPSLEKFMHPEPKKRMGEHHYIGVFETAFLG